MIKKLLAEISFRDKEIEIKDKFINKEYTEEEYKTELEKLRQDKIHYYEEQLKRVKEFGNRVKSGQCTIIED